MLAAIIIAIAAGAALFYASYSVSAGVYLKSLCRRRGCSGSVAITFDDGPDPEITPKVLDVLKSCGAKATFFVVGERAADNPRIVERIVAEGHDLGNHSFGHHWSFPLRRTAQIEQDIARCSGVLTGITGRSPKLFRPPFGVTNPMVGGAVRRSGLISVGWSIRSLDTMGGSRERVERKVAGRMRGGDVVLLHDNRRGADTLLSGILARARAKGLKAVTVTELFNIE